MLSALRNRLRTARVWLVDCLREQMVYAGNSNFLPFITFVKYTVDAIRAEQKGEKHVSR